MHINIVVLVTKCQQTSRAMEGKTVSPGRISFNI